ncbi:MAG: HIT domain-containing protein [Candidatus Eisenbacteria bacterium]
MSAAKPARRRATVRAKRTSAATAAGLDKLWAPWRMTWLQNADAPQGCLFCRLAAEKADRRDLVLARDDHALLMLNRYPYSSAHLMVAVQRHAGQFHELTRDEMLAVQRLTALAERALAAEYAPHGLNYGLNVGRVAGAGFPGHFHLHMVPRWNGDTNFMPAIAQTRVLPESLDATWSRLRRAIGALGAAGSDIAPVSAELAPRGRGRHGLRTGNAGPKRKAAKRGA